MKKIIFQVLGVLGFIAIIISAFTIPSNPYEIVPSLTAIGFDKPLWLCIVVGGGFLYLVLFLAIYDKFVGLDS